MKAEFNFDAVDRVHAQRYAGPDVSERPEFYWTSLLSSLMSLPDQEHRPLGEEIAPKPAREGVEMLFEISQYQGSRFRHPLPMNVSSLQQFTKHWRAVVPSINWFRHLFLQSRRKAPESQVTLAELWYISKYLQLLPAYLYRKSKGAPSAETIPVVPAIIYRISLGLHRVVHISFLRHIVLGQPLEAPSLTPAELYEVAEKSGLLVGDFSVCAGPKAMIIQSYQAMIERLETKQAQVEALMDEGFLAYSALFLKLEMEKYFFVVQAAIQLSELIKALPEQTTSEGLAAFRRALVEFEDWSANNTSPLAHEIAREDAARLLTFDPGSVPLVDKLPRGEIRKRAIRGLQALKDIAEQQLAARETFGGQAILDRVAQIKNLSGGLKAESREVLVKLVLSHGIDSGAAGLIIDYLSEYLRMERCSVAVFELLQREISRLVDRPEPITMTEQCMAIAFGKRFRDFFCEFFGVRIRNSSESTVLVGDQSPQSQTVLIGANPWEN